MARLPDWRARLLTYLSATANKPFRPGQHDCILFVGGARAAVSGTNPMAGWRGRYSSVEGGLALARSLGCDDPFAYVVDGLDEIHPSLARAGDLALVQDAGGAVPAMGVVQGGWVYVLGLRGHNLIPLLAADRAWRQ
jgi:hypothetical protein